MKTLRRKKMAQFDICTYCKVDTDGGQYASDGDFVCEDCAFDDGDDDE